MKTQNYEVHVNIPSVTEFAQDYRQYGKLANGDYGFLFETIMSPEAFVKGRIATLDFGLSAVDGVAEICYQATLHKRIEWTGTIKQFIGAVVCSLMTANGFEKTGKKKAMRHHAFTKGELYRLAK